MLVWLADRPGLTFLYPPPTSSMLVQESDLQETGEVNTSPLKCPDFCFTCYKPLTFPCVMWHGRDAQIWLHLDCFEKLSSALQRDVDESRLGKVEADRLHGSRLDALEN